MEKIEAQIANEEAERAARASANAGDEESEGEEEMVVVRKNPNHFPVNSPSYWRAVANATVRTYVCLFPEPKTFDGVCQAIAQSNLKSIRGNCGESSVVVLLDLDLLGESMGPACQPNLRKQFQAQPSLLSKLVHGAMVARGSQKVNDEGQATAVVEGDLVMVHIGVGRSKREVKALFAVPGGKQQRTDSELKESIITYNDEALRTRKQKGQGQLLRTLCAGHGQCQLSVPVCARENV